MGSLLSYFILFVSLALIAFGASGFLVPVLRRRLGSRRLKAVAVKTPASLEEAVLSGFGPSPFAMRQAAVPAGINPVAHVEPVALQAQRAAPLTEPETEQAGDLSPEEPATSEEAEPVLLEEEAAEASAIGDVEELDPNDEIMAMFSEISHYQGPPSILLEAVPAVSIEELLAEARVVQADLAARRRKA